MQETCFGGFSVFMGLQELLPLRIATSAFFVYNYVE